MQAVSAEDRFWSRVQKGEPGECWKWTGCKCGGGYGQMSAFGRHWQAHVLVWFLTHGKMPEGRLLHSCDCRTCVNPAHLSEGTQSQNMIEARDRGRVPFVRLTRESVIEIRHLHATGGATTGELAQMHGVSTACISNVVKGKRWSDVPQPKLSEFQP